MDPPLRPLKVHLDGIPSIQHFDYRTQLAVIHKLAALSPAIHVTDKDHRIVGAGKDLERSNTSANAGSLQQVAQAGLECLQRRRLQNPP